MNTINVLDFLTSSAEGTITSRRDALQRLAQVGLGAALASVPFWGAAARRAAAQSAPSAVDILNYALTLEYLEDAYYRQGLDATLESGDPLIPGAARDIYGQIGAHESAHVTLLAGTIEDIGGTPVALEDSDFDFTAGGAFDPFGDYATFLLLSQAFEDTGVRAYKGQAGFLAGNDLLTPALQIHSVEARHAAEVRRLRAERGASVKPWITRDDGTDGTPVEAVYAGEESITQAGVDQTTLGSYSVGAASAAYDEPLTREAVAGADGIAAPFLA